MGQPFAVEWVDAPGKRLHEDNEDYWAQGTSSVQEQRIIVRTTPSGEIQLRDTVLHEILHAITKMTAHRDDFVKGGEERVVYAVTTALLQVLRENPDVTSWIIEP